MKLFEMYNVEPKYAWLEPAAGPEDIKGVRLAFIEPIEPKFKAQIEDAHNKKDTKREEMFRLRMQNYLKQGQKFFTPDLGWWMSAEDFHEDKNGFGGPNATKTNIYNRYPDLEVFPSRDAAVLAAKKAKVI